VAPRQRSDMRIFVKTLTGRTVTLDVESSDAVEKLICMAQLAGEDSVNTRFHFAGKDLEIGRTLGDYNITNESCVYMLLRLRAGARNASVMFPGEHQQVSDAPTQPVSLQVVLEKGDTMEQLRIKIAVAASTVRATRPIVTAPSIPMDYSLAVGAGFNDPCGGALTDDTLRDLIEREMEDEAVNLYAGPAISIPDGPGEPYFSEYERTVTSSRIMAALDGHYAGLLNHWGEIRDLFDRFKRQAEPVWKALIDSATPIVTRGLRNTGALCPVLATSILIASSPGLRKYALDRMQERLDNRNRRDHDTFHNLEYKLQRLRSQKAAADTFVPTTRAIPASQTGAERVELLRKQTLFVELNEAVCLSRETDSLIERKAAWAAMGCAVLAMASPGSHVCRETASQLLFWTQPLVWFNMIGSDHRLSYNSSNWRSAYADASDYLNALLRCRGQRAAACIIVSTADNDAVADDLQVALDGLGEVAPAGETPYDDQTAPRALDGAGLQCAPQQQEPCDIIFESTAASKHPSRAPRCLTKGAGRYFLRAFAQKVPGQPHWVAWARPAGVGEFFYYDDDRHEEEKPWGDHLTTGSSNKAAISQLLLYVLEKADYAAEPHHELFYPRAGSSAHRTLPAAAPSTGGVLGAILEPVFFPQFNQYVIAAYERAIIAKLNEGEDATKFQEGLNSYVLTYTDTAAAHAGALLCLAKASLLRAQTGRVTRSAQAAAPGTPAQAPPRATAPPTPTTVPPPTPTASTAPPTPPPPSTCDVCDNQMGSSPDAVHCSGPIAGRRRKTPLQCLHKPSPAEAHRACVTNDPNNPWRCKVCTPPSTTTTASGSKRPRPPEPTQPAAPLLPMQAVQAPPSASGPQQPGAGQYDSSLTPAPPTISPPAPAAPPPPQPQQHYTSLTRTRSRKSPSALHARLAVSSLPAARAQASERGEPSVRATHAPASHSAPSSSERGATTPPVKAKYWNDGLAAARFAGHLQFAGASASSPSPFSARTPLTPAAPLRHRPHTLQAQNKRATNGGNASPPRSHKGPQSWPAFRAPA
jgi:hypothetical protein